MTKAKKATRRRKGQSASKAMLCLIKDWKLSESFYRGKGFSFNDVLNTAVRLAKADTLQACQKDLKEKLGA